MSQAKAGAAARLREHPEMLDAAFSQLRAAVFGGVLPAAALAVGDATGTIRFEASRTDRQPLSGETNFFLASLTKPIFASAFMQLVEGGQVGLHEPIARQVPEFIGGGRELVTPWHVLTHTSGVADVGFDVIRSRRASAAKVTRLVIDAPLKFQPGTRWEYCSASFYLLGLLIERLSSLPYPRYLEERLAKPLGMATTFDAQRAGRPTMPVEGVGVDNRLTRFLVMRFLARAAIPGGGLFGNAEDLVRFGAATLAPRAVEGRLLPLAPETVALMGEDHVKGIVGEVDGEERAVHFGLGWGKPTLMRDTPGSAAVVSHGGASGGRLWIDPEAGLVIVYLTNRWAADRAPERATIAAVYRALEA